MSSFDALLFCGVGAAVLLLDDTRSTPHPQVFIAPPPADVPSVKASQSVLWKRGAGALGSICGVELLPTDGPGGEIAPGSAPWRFYSAQRAALERVHGSSLIDRRPVPLVPLSCLRDWAVLWYEAYATWAFAQAKQERSGGVGPFDFYIFGGASPTEAASRVIALGLVEDELLARGDADNGTRKRSAFGGAFGILPEWLVGDNSEDAPALASMAGLSESCVRAGRALGAELAGVLGLLNQGMPPATVLPLVCARMMERIARVAIEISNTGHLPPLAERYARGFGGFANAYVDNFNEHVVTPIADAVPEVAGFAGSLLSRAILGGLESPVVCIGLLCAVAWRLRK